MKCDSLGWPHITKDVRVILDVLHDARVEKKPVWLAVEDRISMNRISLRTWRKKVRESWDLPMYVREHAERVCHRYLLDNRRVRRLARAYASWRKP